jgi:hypothetical protein
MKSNRTFFLLLFGALLLMFPATQLVRAQILNSGFENWTGGEPDNWTTNNAVGFPYITQSSSAHGGSSALTGTVISFMSFGIPPLIISGTTDNPAFAVSQRYGSLHGYYKYSPVGGDKMSVSAAMEKNSVGIGGGIFIDSVAYSSYREFVASITYPGSEIPDSINITMTILNSAGLAHAGSAFTIDDLSLGGSTGIRDAGNLIPQKFSLASNYPNPFNPSTTIGYSLPEHSHVRLFVTDITGRIVADLVNEQEPAGNYRSVFDASSLSSGVYYYTLRTGSWSSTKPMLLMK